MSAARPPEGGSHRSREAEGSPVSAARPPEGGSHRSREAEGSPVSSSEPAPGTARAVRSFLAFDYGTKRVGVATGNTLMRLTQPLRTLALEGDARFKAIAALITEWTPDALVIGVPFHPDGAAHDNTARARRFGRQLNGRFGLPVHEVDERYTTVDAQAAGARDADAAAAALILEQFFRENE